MSDNRFWVIENHWIIAIVRTEDGPLSTLERWDPELGAWMPMSLTVADLPVTEGVRPISPADAAAMGVVI